VRAATPTIDEPSVDVPGSDHQPVSADRIACASA
jgi:hypothetical protein